MRECVYFYLINSSFHLPPVIGTSDMKVRVIDWLSFCVFWISLSAAISIISVLLYEFAAVGCLYILATGMQSRQFNLKGKSETVEAWVLSMMGEEI